MLHFYILDIAHWDHDTKYLTFEQIGLYITIGHYYLSTRCYPLPLDISQLPKIIAPSIKPSRAKPKIQEVLDKTFVKTEEGYINQRFINALKKAKFSPDKTYF